MDRRALVALYAASIFANALLLFLVQPPLGKALLPWFGGAAAVWTVCLLFFQALLLAGYLLAHLVATRLSPRAQGWAQLGLIAASLASLPIAPDAALAPLPDAEPTWPLLRLLATGVGLPYLVLATSSPLLQRWFAADLPGRSPYRLFALSNAGSLAALAAYPFLIEPAIGVATQLAAWSAAYLLAALPFAALALRQARAGAAPPQAAPTAPAGPAQVARWTALAAAASALLLTVTAQLTQNVAPMPLLWLAPLVLYLLSFVLCFESARWYRRLVFLGLLPTALAALARLPSLELADWPLAALIAAYLAAAFVAFMACHGELARAKPPAGDLTRFYLWIAAGGALGGLAVALVAPRVFDSDPDLALATFAVGAAVVAAALTGEGAPRAPERLRLAALSLAGLIGLGWLLWSGREKETGSTLVAARNFHGTLRIEENGEASRKRQLFHGRILHGEQYLAPDRRRLPTAYYGAASGAGLAIAATRRDGEAQRVGVIGLGAGTLAAHGRAGDVYRFYEINRLVIDVARERFTFLADSPAATEIAVGDARLVLAREAPRGFDVLVVDAFSGDAIPVHLLTVEAMALWIAHLAPGGLLAIHVSNRFLDLAPVIAAAAAELGWTARTIESPGDEDGVTASATWIVVAADGGAFLRPKLIGAGPPELAKRPWRDDFSSLLAVMRGRRGLD